MHDPGMLHVARTAMLHAALVVYLGDVEDLGADTLTLEVKREEGGAVSIDATHWRAGKQIEGYSL